MAQGSHQFWGPRRDFCFGHLDADQPREEGGGLLWCQRALWAYYFIQHDNNPAAEDEIREWCNQLTPEKVLEAVRLAITIGLP